MFGCAPNCWRPYTRRMYIRCGGPQIRKGWLTPARMIAAFVAEDCGQLIGHVVLVDRQTSVPGLAEVSRLYVSPSRRGRGVGAALMEAVTSHGRGLGRSLCLDLVEARTTSGQFYERRGWRLVSRKPARWVTQSGRRPTLRRYEI